MRCKKIKYWEGMKELGGAGQISQWEAGLELSLDWALLAQRWEEARAAGLEADRRSGAVPGADSIRGVLMPQQQQQQKRKGGKGRKGSCGAGCHGDPKEV